MIYINDKAHPFEKEQVLSSVLNDFKIDAAKGIAIAVNNKVIPRSEWNDLKINKNDKLLLIKATQGG